VRFPQYKGSPFKVPKLDRWLVIVSGPEAVEELRHAPENVISIKEAAAEVCLHIITRNQLTNGHFRFSLQITRLDQIYLIVNGSDTANSPSAVANLLADPYHLPVIRNQLTKSLGTVFPDLRDEVVQAFDSVIPRTDGLYCTRIFLGYLLTFAATITGWTKFSASSHVSQIVCRVTNRLFVGLPLCG
jgi:hypothetical protein